MMMRSLPSPLRLLTSTQFLTTPKRYMSQRTISQRTMSTSPFTLEPAIFNATLYKRVTDLWLPGIDTNGSTLDMSIAKRWFGMGTAAEKRAFDAECTDAFAQALESIGPGKFPEASAKPFVDEIRRVPAEATAWTALSLVLLLDQMPRNIYRSGVGLRSVYTHYDKISYALTSTLLSSDSPVSRPDTSAVFQRSAAHRCWFYMPLVHSEELVAHDLLNVELASFASELEVLQDVDVSKAFLMNQVKSEKEHRDILDTFGRYPHRNAALGRESTAEEIEFLKQGGATFGVEEEK